MKEERLNVSPDELSRYLEQAHQLRTRELARISGQFFRLPQSLLNRFGANVKNANKTASQVS